LEITKNQTFRIVHAVGTHAEAVANELADEYVLTGVHFYVFEGVEKVGMMFVRKPTTAVINPRAPIRMG
jgi:hypothetical protein